MKKSMTITEFQQAVDALAQEMAQALTTTRARMESLRSGEQPPG